MHYEYAVEPEAIGSDWQTFRYVIEKFGFDKGRIISQFPKHWFREVYRAAEGLPTLQKKRIEVALNQSKKNKIVRSGRPFDPRLGGWLDNALAEHARIPFHAVIATENRETDDFVVPIDEIDELHSLIAVSHDCAVERCAATLAASMKVMLELSSKILFVDPFFDPFKKNYIETLRACLEIVSTSHQQSECEVHYRYHRDKPSNDELEREARELFCGVIPDGLSLVFFCWKEREKGADFHARYLLTEKGGIAVDAGFSAEGKHQTTDMHLMSYELAQEKLRSFAIDANDYELVGPVLRVFANGDTEHVLPAE